ncbi:unnamed protein product [Vitrella brassicaformis CCMP3155]|uniref:Uncharacterized protein n=1 Tax=Vitrella brassicaformis (strain CCMP3155) TaxID=1169540 RepID=A0A0G4EYP1_VITBC|nr:unnamed protein product [Vitrella brassicaformis CCMP3155]|eukprot:CEM04061.1 unnamed protein product [Vitrella brassicaformis CCMP3155]
MTDPKWQTAPIGVWGAELRIPLAMISALCAADKEQKPILLCVADDMDITERSQEKRPSRELHRHLSMIFEIKTGNMPQILALIRDQQYLLTCNDATELDINNGSQATFHSAAFSPSAFFSKHTATVSDRPVDIIVATELPLCVFMDVEKADHAPIDGVPFSPSGKPLMSVFLHTDTFTIEMPSQIPASPDEEKLIPKHKYNVRRTQL